MSLENIDAAILCGGLGKRLRKTIGRKQKTFVEFNGRPFLDIVLNSLKRQGIKRVILLTGYQAKELETYYRKNTQGLKISFSREKTPLGTGGAVKHAKKLIQSKTCLVLNGDCFSDINLKKMVSFHRAQKAMATIAVSKVNDNKGFGGIVLGKDCDVSAFIEKGKDKKIKNVNAGIYCLSKDAFKMMPTQKKFSLEYDFFPCMIGHRFYGFKTQDKFYDIGTPERLNQARNKLKK
jgi:D-glycero-alpha-D-manno-heptose 1-phosphate guanylyltransferase